jgi:predicted RecB family nuclease
MTESLTGRDDAILMQALAYAIVTIDRLPRDRQEWSNREDMWALLTARVGLTEREQLLKDVRQQMGVRMLLDPQTAPDDEYDEIVQLLREALQIIDEASGADVEPLDIRDWLRSVRMVLASIDGPAQTTAVRS